MIPITESLDNIWFNSIENEEASIPDSIAYGVSDKKIDYMLGIFDSVERLLKAKRSEIVFTRLDSITEEVDPKFFSHFKTVKAISKYAMSLRQDDKGNKIVCVPRYGSFDVYFADEDTAWDILKQYEIDWDNYEEDEYTPSSTYGDYSPSNPWDAPGMSKQDFI